MVSTSAVRTGPQLIDISVPVSPATTEWPGDTPFSCGWIWDMAAGASVNVSRVTMSPHVGTHADAPIHVTPGGRGADALPLTPFHGPAIVVDVSDVEGVVSHAALTARLPAAISNGTVHGSAPERLLLKTNRTIASGSFPDRWASLALSAVDTLVAGGLVLLGVDCPSVDDRDSKTLDVHHALFNGGAFLLENLDLRAVPPGRYELIAYPTKFVALDAAPVRAVLRPITG